MYHTNSERPPLKSRSACTLASIVATSRLVLNSPSPIQRKTAGLRKKLLAWYDQNRRQLPWRGAPGISPDAYHILVSEAMLQQTQVATVIPYFLRFIEQLPTLEALAGSNEQHVLRLWQGLGYYRRARNLHAASGKVYRLYGGQIPDTVEALLTLPGVGRYTAGAIASIAFNKRAPILDGNVARVLARWYAVDRPVTDSATRTRLWSLAESLVPKNRPGDFNQAMMDFGATVCLARGPQCEKCPVVRQCLAKTKGCVERLPIQSKRRPPRPVTHHVLAIQKKGAYLFQQRPNTGLWSAMWQMPTIELEKPKSARIDQLQQWVAQNLGLTINPPRRSCGFRHQTTHRTIGFVLWTTSVHAGRLRQGSGRWQRLNQLDELPLANPQRQIVKLLANS